MPSNLLQMLSTDGMYVQLKKKPKWVTLFSETDYVQVKLAEALINQHELLFISYVAETGGTSFHNFFFQPRASSSPFLFYPSMLSSPPPVGLIWDSGDFYLIYAHFKTGLCRLQKNQVCTYRNNAEISRLLCLKKKCAASYAGYFAKIHVCLRIHLQAKPPSVHA